MLETGTSTVRELTHVLHVARLVQQGPNHFAEHLKTNNTQVGSGQVISKQTTQVGSECLTGTFRARCCSACLSRAQVPDFAGSSVQDRNEPVRITCACHGHRYGPSPVPLSGTGKKKGGGSKGGPLALVGTREYEQSNWNR